LATELDDTKQQAIARMRRIYNETVVDHALNPRNTGSMADADGFANVTTGGGDSILMWLRVKDDRIAAATFWTDACAATIASVSMVTELAKGKTVTEALGINQHDVLGALGGLPEGNVHCARQAADTLKEAVKDYLALKREPWKKNYRRY